MGIRFLCPNGHKLHVKDFLAGKRGVCPNCQARFYVPTQSMPNLRVAPAQKRGSGDSHPPTGVNQPAASATPAGPNSDPLAGPPDTHWHVRYASGEQFGPAAPDVMRRWLAEGRVPADALVWRSDWEQWRAAQDVFESSDDQPIGSEFEFDPQLLSPRQPAPAVAAEEIVEIEPLDESPRPSRAYRRLSQQRTTKIIAGLVVALFVLLPLLWYVLFAA